MVKFILAERDRTNTVKGLNLLIPNVDNIDFVREETAQTCVIGINRDTFRVMGSFVDVEQAIKFAKGASGPPKAIRAIVEGRTTAPIPWS